jgi:hypothetical protein
MVERRNFAYLAESGHAGYPERLNLFQTRRACLKRKLRLKLLKVEDKLKKRRLLAGASCNILQKTNYFLS